MKRRGKNKNIPVVLLSVVIALAMVLYTSLSGGRTSPVEAAVKGLFSPAQRAVSGLISWVGELQDYVSSVDSYKEENTSLKAELAQLRLQLQSASLAEAENDELRRLLKLSREHESFTFIPVDVISGNTSNYTSDFTVGSGSSAGLSEGMCVVSLEGCVIGSVSRVGSSWAVITTVLDPSVQISACVKGSSEVCVASGDYAVMNTGKFVLKYLSSSSAIHNGDTIVTSGSGGVYPGGLTLGQVDDVTADSSGLSESALIRPAAELHGLSKVFVIVSTGADQQQVEG
ncbi:MAG: rod shape-determining protein MreC [Oscillospiraceae bacterium]|nr:rod shape-determining protein MreC [Oscillospiraceae bacterium]